MQYYYQRKAEILSGQVVKWDFAQFDSTDPEVSLGTLMG
jgi:phage terminase large subunit-like protein